jgi:hypothetical protein
MFTLAIAKSDIEYKETYLNSQGCVVPVNRPELLALWNRIDSTQSNLGWSLVSWKSNSISNSQSTYTGRTLIQLSLTKPTDPLTIKLHCPGPQSVEFYIASNDGGETLRQVFTAQVQTGAFKFKPSIFPIATVLDGKFILGMNSTTCSFA